MRKSSALSPSRIVQAALVVLAISACDSERSAQSAAVTPASAVGDGAAASVGGFTGRDEAQSQKLSVANEAASMAPSARPRP